MTTVAGKMTEGWAYPLNSRKAHYFVNGLSLCGKWIFRCEIEAGDQFDGGAHDCRPCARAAGRRALEKESSGG